MSKFLFASITSPSATRPVELGPVSKPQSEPHDSLEHLSGAKNFAVAFERLLQEDTTSELAKYPSMRSGAEPDGEASSKGTENPTENLNAKVNPGSDDVPDKEWFERSTDVNSGKEASIPASEIYPEDAPLLIPQEATSNTSNKSGSAPLGPFDVFQSGILEHELDVSQDGIERRSVPIDAASQSSKPMFSEFDVPTRHRVDKGTASTMIWPHPTHATDDSRRPDVSAIDYAQAGPQSGSRGTEAYGNPTGEEPAKRQNNIISELPPTPLQAIGLTKTPKTEFAGEAKSTGYGADAKGGSLLATPAQFASTAEGLSGKMAALTQSGSVSGRSASDDLGVSGLNGPPSGHTQKAATLASLSKVSDVLAKLSPNDSNHTATMKSDLAPGEANLKAIETQIGRAPYVPGAANLPIPQAPVKNALVETKNLRERPFSGRLEAPVSLQMAAQDPIPERPGSNESTAIRQSDTPPHVRLNQLPMLNRQAALLGHGVLTPTVMTPVPQNAQALFSSRLETRDVEPIGRGDTVSVGSVGLVAEAPSLARQAFAGQPVQADLPRHIAHQIMAASRIGGDMAAELHLSPSELGRVRISLSSSEAGMVVSILADRPETLELMRRHADQLAQEFHTMGYQASEFSFGQSPSDQSERDERDPDRTETSDLIDTQTDSVSPDALVGLSSIRLDRVDLRM